MIMMMKTKGESAWMRTKEEDARRLIWKTHLATRNAKTPQYTT